MTAQDDKAMTRRDFLKRSAAAGATIAGAGVLGYFLHDKFGLTASGTAAGTLGDFSVPDVGARMAIATGSDRAATIRAALSAVGGIETFIRRGDRVVLKVNAAFASPPIVGATTHPDVVGELARLCIKAGAKEVIVTDNSIYDPSSCFELSGIGPAARRAGAKLMLPKSSHFSPMTVAGGRLVRDWPVLTRPLDGATRLIGVGPIKHHARAGASMSMKNWYGLLGGNRSKFHQDINGIITELAMMVKPTLVVLDGTTVMMRNGPTGGALDDLKTADTMIVGTDQVATDAFGATLLDIDVAELPYIAKAAEAGAGTADYRSLAPVRVSAS